MSFRIVADENMPNVESWFSSVATSIKRVPGRTLNRSDLSDADVLLVRSVTRVDANLLQGTPVKFVGSATIGTDHIDQTFLKDNGIQFHFAPGCNAQSVADWVLAVLSRLHIDAELEWWQKKIGIVGVGNVGSTVKRALQAHQCHLLLNDPLKYEDGKLADHQPLETVLSSADILCFHTPHTASGKYPTDRMMNRETLANVKPGTWVINAGRGPVFDREAIIEAKKRGVHFVLDVWPDEPVVDQKILSCCHLASPHVAGYSLEGKFKGTEMLARAFFSWANLDLTTEAALPKSLLIDASLYEQPDLRTWASEIMLAVYDPARDTATMASSVQNNEITPAMFDALRKSYPTRRELRTVTIKNAPEQLAPLLVSFQQG